MASRIACSENGLSCALLKRSITLEHCATIFLEMGDPECGSVFRLQGKGPSTPEGLWDARQPIFRDGICGKGGPPLSRLVRR